MAERIPDEKINKMLEEYKAGTKISVLSRKYDVKQETIRNRFSKLGVEFKRMTPEQVKERDKEAIRMIKAGVPRNEISEKLGMSPSTITMAIYREEGRDKESGVTVQRRNCGDRENIPVVPVKRYNIAPGTKFTMEINTASSFSTSDKLEVYECTAIKQHRFCLEYERYDNHGNKRRETVDLFKLAERKYKVTQR